MKDVEDEPNSHVTCAEWYLQIFAVMIFQPWQVKVQKRKNIYDQNPE